ncbi:hypothetical protein N7448_007810 [Penicillium atrosanguineum]|uniref:uncharacterized protein n=1 Tax=Penicillium atrosanguineum TaxID=1132637 RepID=UPI00239DF63C|nr:uncharacterized protein N7443_001169 [Penicillium atrosanguineum]KAJ5127031.1 hypothetical protein N7448_007810 [Penicillium atrosanguineum]KAJ5147236.1 hypothetical protein N7526_000588 [Penicillium atrosanguineum]KAJ5314285.1 hypothetical protein N7443_001169 [Penicillium atrosanguineum]
MATTLTGGNPHIIQLPSTPAASPPEARVIAQQWLTSLENQLARPDTLSLASLFHAESWWRDMLALDWDMRTAHSSTEIEELLRKRQTHTQLHNLRLQDKGKFQPRWEQVVDELSWVSSMFFFETACGTGSGMLRLTQDQSDGKWKAYAVYTSLQELKGSEEPLGQRRPAGTTESMPGGLAGGTWIERRERQKEFLDSEPTVLVVGAGQAGLNMGARLQNMSLSCLIVDKNERVGDNWRNRYRTLVTHDPAEFTHMAYLPFPQNWPQFTPKDKLGDWFEAYASIMELNVWMKTFVTSAEYNDATAEWNVTVTRGNGAQRTLRPRHVVWCTGHSGEARVPRFPGQDSFQGTVYHGSQHQDASESDVRGKKVIVVGTGNSGHDIAQNYYENGADVTMLQRSGTYVLTADKGVFMMHKGMHEDGGPPTEECDVVSESLPFPVQFALSVHMTKRIANVEKETLDGLRRAGFQLDFGPDGAGIARAYYTAGGGYYIDVGCSQLIIDGKIKVKHSPKGIEGFGERELRLADGSSLPADIIVLATGYDNMRTTVRKVLGDKVADRCADVWDLDHEGELRSMWRPSGHPGFWFFGGNLALCRIYSKFLALQIKAIESDLSPGDRLQQRATKI